MDQKEIMLFFPTLLDCVAPYNIDVWFDKGNDKQNAAGNDYTSCGKCNISKPSSEPFNGRLEFQFGP